MKCEIFLWLSPQLILLLKWKHNNINKKEEKTNKRLVCKKTNLSWISSISRLIYSLQHRRRRHSTCGAVSCPNGLIYLRVSYVCLIRNIFFLSLPLSPSLLEIPVQMRMRESISSCHSLIFFSFSPLNNDITTSISASFCVM